jgi:hypothetical protein
MHPMGLGLSTMCCLFWCRCAVQGDDAVHDAVRIRQLEVGVPRRVTAALRNHGIGNDDVLWAVLFMLAVLVRDDSVVYGRASNALIGAGVFKVRLLVLPAVQHVASSGMCVLLTAQVLLAVGVAANSSKQCNPGYAYSEHACCVSCRCWTMRWRSTSSGMQMRTQTLTR